MPLIARYFRISSGFLDTAQAFMNSSHCPYLLYRPFLCESLSNRPHIEEYSGPPCGEEKQGGGSCLTLVSSGSLQCCPLNQPGIDVRKIVGN
jgi:hypothetical protein